MKLLSMTPEYINWTREGKKTATTRTKNKGTGRFELVSGSRYKPKKADLTIEVASVIAWTPASIGETLKAVILREEGFCCWPSFMATLERLNRTKIPRTQRLWTHFYRVVRT